MCHAVVVLHCCLSQHPAEPRWAFGKYYGNAYNQAFIRLNNILFKFLPLDKMFDGKSWLTKLTHVLRKLSMSITVLLSFNGTRFSQFWATETYSHSGRKE